MSVCAALSTGLSRQLCPWATRLELDGHLDFKGALEGATQRAAKPGFCYERRALPRIPESEPLFAAGW